MKSARLIFLSLCTLTTLCAEIRLHGVLESDGRCLVALSASEERTQPLWVSVGATFRGHSVKSYDAKREVVRLEGKDGMVEAKLVRPQVKRDESEIDITKLPDEELVARGLYRLHPGDTGMKVARLAKLTILELLALNPGVNFSKLKVGELLAIAKEPNKAPEPTPGSVTPHAGACVAPAPVVAHL